MLPLVMSAWYFYSLLHGSVALVLVLSIHQFKNPVKGIEACSVGIKISYIQHVFIGHNVNYYRIDPISDPIRDPINDPLSELDLEILKAIKENPGMNTVAITDRLNAKLPSVNRDKVKNALKRNLVNYVEHIGSNKTGGY